VKEFTPMMRQYLEIKEQYKDTVLFYRLGDFYEMFFDDAKLASKELELTLTGRDCGQEERAPMCGVPFHSSDGYIARLVNKGYKVAICEQTEDPSQAKGLVKREVVKIVTPGTLTDTEALDEKKNNYICALISRADGTGITFADVSTGELFATQITEKRYDKIINELGKFTPSEVVITSQTQKIKEINAFLSKRLECMQTISQEIGDSEASNIVRSHFQDKCKDIDFEKWSPAIYSVAVLLNYLNNTQKTELSHINELKLYEQAQTMDIDLSTRRNLELTETMRNKEKKGSLLWVLDRTKTAMGSRLMKKYIEQPLINIVTINNRLNAVSELNDNHITRQEISELLNSTYDIERLMSRIALGSANAKDLLSLYQTISLFPDIRKMISGFTTALINEIYNDIDNLDDISQLIGSAIVKEPPFSIREGGMIKRGYNSELDELIDIVNNVSDVIKRTENREKERTGIKNLKISYNRVFGYYIEVTNSYKELVPEEYIRKQTLANCERYITQELKELEDKILSAKERIYTLEYELFIDLRNKIASQIRRIQRAAYGIAKLDVMCSFSETAQKNNYVRPEMDCENIINIKDGRHPVVEKMLGGSMFVANDIYLDNKDENLHIITGPNMAGKSTFMRQVAIITVMAQIGSFVPASYARIGIVDKIFTRVGASDDLAAGQSTFMVEMSEVAYILKNATKKSLLIFDEIGRGTSTFDGMSIARAVLEYVADKKKIGAKTLFATHYHELTDLEGKLEGVKNYNVVVKKKGDDITFLRKIVRGGTDDSYGIEVAKIAGIPNAVIERAKEILKSIESEQEIPEKKKSTAVHIEEDDDMQISFESTINDTIIQKLKDTDVNVLSPIEALNLLYEIKKEII